MCLFTFPTELNPTGIDDPTVSNLQKRKLRKNMPTFIPSSSLTLCGAPCQTVKPQESKVYEQCLLIVGRERGRYSLVWASRRIVLTPLVTRFIQDVAILLFGCGTGYGQFLPYCLLGSPSHWRMSPAAALGNSLKTGKGWKTSFGSLGCLERWHLGN